MFLIECFHINGTDWCYFTLIDKKPWVCCSISFVYLMLWVKSLQNEGYKLRKWAISFKSLLQWSNIIAEFESANNDSEESKKN